MTTVVQRFFVRCAGKQNPKEEKLVHAHLVEQHPVIS